MPEFEKCKDDLNDLKNSVVIWTRTGNIYVRTIQFFTCMKNLRNRMIFLSITNQRNLIELDNGKKEIALFHLKMIMFQLMKNTLKKLSD